MKKLAAQTHKDRVHSFNAKLESLSEHHDIPKVSYFTLFLLLYRTDLSCFRLDLDKKLSQYRLLFIYVLPVYHFTRALCTQLALGNISFCLHESQSAWGSDDVDGSYFVTIDLS